MQKNYLVLAHKNPDQLYRMITALNDNVSHFFIHIDAKSPIAPLRNTYKDYLSILLIKGNAVFGEIFQ